MPTGYTYQLEELDYDLEKWLTEKLIRAFGLCCSLRDDGDLTEEQIIEALSPKVGAKGDPPKMPSVRELRQNYNQRRRRLILRIANMRANKIKYDEAVAKLEKLEEVPLKSELVNSVIAMAQSQLSLIASDYNTEYYERELEKSFEDYCKLEKESYGYRLEGYNEEVTTDTELLDTYKKYVSDVRELMKSI
jgi:hypothetical protein